MIVAALVCLAALTITTAPASATTLPPRGVLLHMINNVRAEHGLPPVSYSPRLRFAALWHSQDMLNRQYFAHTSPAGSTLYGRVIRCGYYRIGSWTAGENLAWGTGSYGTPAGVLRMWMNSPEHRAILLSRSFESVGISRVVGRFMGHSDAAVWTADFGHH